MSFAGMMFVALLLDALIGWPEAIYQRIGHPVTWLGALISRLERSLNTGEASRRKTAGCFAMALTLLAAAVPAIAIQTLLPNTMIATLIGGVLAWPLIAARSMLDHVRAIETPLKSGDIPAARKAVSMIVGRETAHMDGPAITRASIESLAENTSDGIIAPLFWGVIAGLPGIAIYKAVNTLDSMVGYRTPRYEAFGWASAKLDDVVNFLPARLTGWIFTSVSKRPVMAAKAMFRDANRHRSPNAGWPEAAMAGGLNIRLSGPRIYDGALTQDSYVHAQGKDAEPKDISRALRLYLRAMILCAGLLTVIALL
ncbi:cobalamin biosynthesis protein CobD [Alphaproteobacteria bacterium KMM 3653]|uniref:Cobalamin biosynthesis protein CobD n=1 Tax=Harenicola maris TaxID=2841044 RepID=A0AAP2CLS7_9RHOB|nr:cobalamin biosynthesis protein CobD [Harenicola maris]